MGAGGLCPGGLCPGCLCAEGVSVRETPPPVDRQTPVKLLPCLKLRLWAVNIFEKVFRQASMLTLTYCQLRFIFEKLVC